MVFAQRKCMGGNAFLVGIAGATPLADRELPEIAALNFPDTIGFGVGLRRTCRAKAYLNQHWIPGSPRRPALVPSVGFGPLDSLKAGAGHPPIRGVQGLARTAKWTAPSNSFSKRPFSFFRAETKNVDALESKGKIENTFHRRHRWFARPQDRPRPACGYSGAAENRSVYRERRKFGFRFRHYSTAGRRIIRRGSRSYYRRKSCLGPQGDSRFFSARTASAASREFSGGLARKGILRRAHKRWCELRGNESARAHFHDCARRYH